MLDREMEPGQPLKGWIVEMSRGQQKLKEERVLACENDVLVHEEARWFRGQSSCFPGLAE